MKKKYIKYDKFMERMREKSHIFSEPPIDPDDTIKWHLIQEVETIAEQNTVELELGKPQKSTMRANLMVAGYWLFMISSLFLITYAAIHFNRIAVMWFYLIPGCCMSLTSSDTD